MPKISRVGTDPRESGRGKRPLAKRNTARAAGRLVAAPELMGTGEQLALPRLERVELEYHINAGDEPAVALAKTLLQLDIAVPENWEKAKRDPTAYVWQTLSRWIATHGGQAIKRRFGLTATITSRLDDYSDRDGANPNLLYVAVDSDRAGYVVLGPTLELLEKNHPRLPVTFFHLFAGSLNKWIRVYDYRDAEDRVAMLREWIEGEEDQDQYELPDVEGSIPSYMKQRPLSKGSLGRLRSQVKDNETKAILDGIGANRTFVLQRAVLIYGDGAGAFATLHEVRGGKEGAPYLGPGQSLTTGFLRTLAHGLGVRMAPEILPENVLARTPDLIVWWTRAQHRCVFFGGGSEEAAKLNGHMYPHPPLVFKVWGRDLFVRALTGNARPTAETRLMTAPYWNIDSRGCVCQGTMRVPEEVSAQSIAGWEGAFFGSEFTHPSGAVRLTKHPGGFVGLWSTLAGAEDAFPIEFLTDAKQTLREFIEGDEGR